MKKISIIIILVICAAILSYVAFFSDFRGGHGKKEALNPETLPVAVQSFRNTAAFLHLVSLDEVKVLSYEEREFGDSCLGVQKVDEFCAAVITPGYDMMFSVGGEEFHYRINSDASTFRRID